MLDHLIPIPWFVLTAALRTRPGVAMTTRLFKVPLHIVGELCLIHVKRLHRDPSKALLIPAINSATSKSNDRDARIHDMI
jgi:hypothetical protein